MIFRNFPLDPKEGAPLFHVGEPLAPVRFFAGAHRWLELGRLGGLATEEE